MTLHKEKKVTIKITKHLIWYFQKLRVYVVVDYSWHRVYRDKCWNNHWLREHGVGVVVDSSDMTMTTRTLLEKLLGPLRDFKGTIGQKRYLGVFMKTSYLKKKLHVRMVQKILWHCVRTKYRFLDVIAIKILSRLFIYVLKCIP